MPIDNFSGRASVELSYSLYNQRRLELVANIRKDSPDRKKGLILLFSNFESESYIFEQNSIFRYYSGIDKESGLVAAIKFDEGSINQVLYTPNLVDKRKKYLGHAIEAGSESAKHFDFDDVRLLGSVSDNIFLDRYFLKEECENLIKDIEDFLLDPCGKIYVIDAMRFQDCADQQIAIDRIKSFLKNISEDRFVNIYEEIATMRRKKSMLEVVKITEAIELTASAYDEIAKSLDAQIGESEVQATIEFIFTLGGGKKAYPIIAAGGENATVLHYSQNSCDLNSGDLIIIDAGAKIDGYCADITRTYPVSGVFSKKQKDLYLAVLEAQKYVESIAKPGFYLNNKAFPDYCLTSRAREFMNKWGLEHGLGSDIGTKYFTHAIGHFLGLDVHDVCTGEKIQLQEGDVITIEPGYYNAKEKIGIRIEDNYLVTKDGIICLSDMIPKEADEICKQMKGEFIG